MIKVMVAIAALLVSGCACSKTQKLEPVEYDSAQKMDVMREGLKISGAELVEQKKQSEAKSQILQRQHAQIEAFKRRSRIVVEPAQPCPQYATAKSALPLCVRQYLKSLDK